ncbi:MAG TPA: lamin tail domain-containing protein [Flavitalea sp.]|nr:lamin tail domain-containing protein [Flavitalea sp.]
MIARMILARIYLFFLKAWEYMTLNIRIEKRIMKIPRVHQKACAALSLGMALGLGQATPGHGQQAMPGDIIINEILFNPAVGGYDYVEGYNRSDKILDLAEIQIANRNATQDIASIKALEKSPVSLVPGAYFVVTANEKWVKQQYIFGQNAHFCQLSSLPSFPDKQGTVVLLNKGGDILDELGYQEDWHFGLLADPSGVALERINYAAPTQDKHNWSSAASSAGYGTPGYQNSQFRADRIAKGEITVSPSSFAPDNNGPDGFALIQYNFPEPGFMANLYIYDASGIRVRYLLKNELLGTSGQFKWDGLDDQQKRLPQGIYILLTQVFNLDGRTKKFRHTIVLRRR